MKPTVVVVDAKTPGNVGTIARAMKNFGFTDLVLVDPPELDPDGDAYGFAGQARDDILPNHSVSTFDDIVDSYHTVGFTAVTNEDQSKHVRYPFSTPVTLRDELSGVDVPVALVFGRERVGLHNEEIARLDRVCSIPASSEYPVLNLGQAVTVALYELRGLTVERTQHDHVETSVADPALVERFHADFAAFLETIDHPVEKRAKTARLMRRLVGRANPTGREIRTLLGVLRRATRRIAER